MSSEQKVIKSITDLEEAFRDSANEIMADGRYDDGMQVLELAKRAHGMISEYQSAIQTSDAESRNELVWLGRGYPRYAVSASAGKLIKEAIGKNTRVPYTQEIDKGSYVEIEAWIRSKGQKSWKISDMKRSDEAGSLSHSSYKIYLAVGALEQAGLIHKVKRGTFRVADDAASKMDWWSVLSGRKENVTSVSSTPSVEVLTEDIPF